MVERKKHSMLVLMTTDTVGGVWDYSLELATALVPFGVRFVLATMGPAPSPEQRRAATEIPGLILEESQYRLEWMPESDLDVVRAGRWLLELEERYGPDLIHLNGYAHGALDWQVPCLITAHSCVLSWWQAVKGEPAPQEWTIYARRAEAGLNGSDLVIAPTKAMLSCLESIYGVLPKSKVIWNGRPAHRFTPAAKEEIIFGAGRLWDEAKNLTTLERVGASLEWPVVIAGEWRQPGGGGTPPEGVQYLGQLSAASMAAQLGRAAIYALPARYEPFGLSVLEAGLAGCALVLGDIPSLHELWRDAALFVAPEDDRQLRIVLGEIIANTDLRQYLGRKAHARGLQYSTERMAQGYFESYLQLIATRERSYTSAP